MKMHERIKKIRTDNNMTQSEFAERLGVTRSVISNIELNRLAKPEQKTSLIKLISKEFNINEEWVHSGVGEMFVESDTFSLDEYVKSKGATEFELELIKSYFEMPKDLRTSLEKHFKTKALPKLRAEQELTATKQDIKNSIDYEIESYRQELEAEQKGEISSVLENRKDA